MSLKKTIELIAGQMVCTRKKNVEVYGIVIVIEALCVHEVA